MPRQRRQWAFQETALPLEKSTLSAREMQYDAKEAVQGTLIASRRVLQRHRMRDYRHALALEAKFLTHQAQELERQLARLNKSAHETALGPLPWREIAAALAESVENASDEHKALRNQVNLQQHLVRVMHAWVEQYCSVWPTALTNRHHQTWQHVHLVAHDESRALGLEWITNQLLHQTDAILARCAFPSTCESFLDVQLVPQEDTGGYLYVQRHQTIFHTSPAAAARVLHDIYIKHTSGPTGDIQDLETRFDGESGRYSKQTVEGNHGVHFLRRQFILDDKTSLIVGRNILGDDKYPVGPYVRHGLAWILVKEIAPNCVLYQNYLVLEQLHTPQGEYLSLEQVAAYRGITLPVDELPSKQWKTFEQASQAQAIDKIHAVEDYFCRLLRDSQA
ncbi:hypothetical protein LEN26_017641 [Aphanomyces euteiches]|nr:hypothetical protein LEN26_017641 [Aphanomyces euteiches]KAH9192787.1 hypothetical protein AeNC1_005234 [Aphanomyces euteiches]